MINFIDFGIDRIINFLRILRPFATLKDMAIHVNSCLWLGITNKRLLK
jgi:hypothetical protein